MNDEHYKRLEELVYRLVSSIPEGKISTYKDIAVAAGIPKASRLIGKILNRNPNPIVVPCHRVVRSNGSVGGYRFGTKMKVELLKREGIVINESDMKIVDFNRVRFKLIR
jgi:methylated-DNA-[protein]-cysteine S-methyltransferase